MAGLRRLQQEHHEIGDVRGLGLMVGVEFSGPKGLAKAVQQACLAENMLLLTCGVDDQVVRFIPPLVVGDGEIDEGLAVFGRAIAKATAVKAVGAV